MSAIIRHRGGGTRGSSNKRLCSLLLLQRVRFFSLQRLTQPLVDACSGGLGTDRGLMVAGVGLGLTQKAAGGKVEFLPIFEKPGCDVPSGIDVTSGASF